MFKSLRYKIARPAFWLLRMKSLPRVNRLFKDVESPCYMSRSMFGGTFYLDVSRGATSQLLYMEGERFVEERFIVSSLLKHGMSVVDVGANIGYYLLMFEQCIGESGKVYCIEPSQENLPELKKNIEFNDFPNVKVFEVALGMRDGTTGLRKGINSGVVDSDSGVYEVEIKKLDSLIDEKVDFIKIDVEGYEGQVIKGAEGIIKKYHPILFVELHPHIVPRFGFSIRDILDGLSQFYKQIELYESLSINKDIGFSKRLIKRYFTKGMVVRIENAGDYIEKYNDGKIVHTFWAVCR